MVSCPYIAVSFLDGPPRELTPFKFEYPRLELGVGVLEFMGHPVEVLFELEILVGKLADHPLHIQDTAVGGLIGCIGYRRRVDWISDDDGNISTAAFWTFGISAAPSHDEQEFG